MQDMEKNSEQGVHGEFESAWLNKIKLNNEYESPCQGYGLMLEERLN